MSTLADREMNDSRAANERAHLAVLICFLNEAEHLATLLTSIERQTEPPDQLLLIDDGSTDGSVTIARAFAAAHPRVRVLQRPRRPAENDRLVDAPELQAFAWAVAHLEGKWDIVAKLDGDLELSPGLCEEVRDRFAEDPQLGIVGSYLSLIGPDGEFQHEHHRSDHVRGANKFYRRRCFEQIMPLPSVLGWDTIDELRARRCGWTTASFSPRSGDSLHLRPTGAHDGPLRAYRRWGRCAWGYGSHPLWVLLGSVRRGMQRPYVLCGVNFWWGWAAAALRRCPRAEPELRMFTRYEQLSAIRSFPRRWSRAR